MLRVPILAAIQASSVASGTRKLAGRCMRSTDASFALAAPFLPDKRFNHPCKFLEPALDQQGCDEIVTNGKLQIWRYCCFWKQNGLVELTRLQMFDTAVIILCYSPGTQSKPGTGLMPEMPCSHQQVHIGQSYFLGQASLNPEFLNQVFPELIWSRLNLSLSYEILYLGLSAPQLTIWESAENNSFTPACCQCWTHCLTFMRYI